MGSLNAGVQSAVEDGMQNNSDVNSAIVEETNQSVSHDGSVVSTGMTGKDDACDTKKSESKSRKSEHKEKRKSRRACVDDAVEDGNEKNSKATSTFVEQTVEEVAYELSVAKTDVSGENFPHNAKGSERGIERRENKEKNQNWSTGAGDAIEDGKEEYSNGTATSGEKGIEKAYKGEMCTVRKDVSGDVAPGGEKSKSKGRKRKHKEKEQSKAGVETTVEEDMERNSNVTPASVKKAVGEPSHEDVTRVKTDISNFQDVSPDDLRTLLESFGPVKVCLFSSILNVVFVVSRITSFCFFSNLCSVPRYNTIKNVVFPSWGIRSMFSMPLGKIPVLYALRIQRQQSRLFLFQNLLGVSPQKSSLLL